MVGTAAINETNFNTKGILNAATHCFRNSDANTCCFICAQTLSPGHSNSVTEQTADTTRTVALCTTDTCIHAAPADYSGTNRSGDSFTNGGGLGHTHSDPDS